MDKKQSTTYYKGYIAGYRDGISNTALTKASQIKENGITDLPIQAMELSARAYNCLARAGCIYVSDVVELNDQTIARMRNLGTKTASEIACWLDTHGIHYSAWSAYL